MLSYYELRFKGFGDNMFYSEGDRFELMDNLRKAEQEWTDLNELIDSAALNPKVDMLSLQRMKKRRLLLKDTIIKLRSLIYPDTIA